MGDCPEMGLGELLGVGLRQMAGMGIITMMTTASIAMPRRYGNVIYINRDPNDPYKGWGWIEVTTEDINRYGIPTADPRRSIAVIDPYKFPKGGNLPSRGRAGAKTFAVNIDGELITLKAQKSLTVGAVCAWIKTWAPPTATVVTPGNRTVSIDGDVMARATHFVYFILNEDSRAIKIGRAKNLEKRMKTLQTASPAPLKLLKSIQVSSGQEAHELEQSLHERFSALRLWGEWFRAEGELLAYVEQGHTDA